jgi:hypothetical protein
VPAPTHPRNVLLLFAVLLALAGGCQPSKQAAGQGTPMIRKGATPAAAGAGGAAGREPVAAISNTDPCAGQLHDICEPLLFYYLKNHRLPGRLEELRTMPGFESIDLTCPVSKKPYLYNPVGITTAESRARIICYDPAPSHSGMRWAISIIEPEEENGPLVTKVIALPESHFTFMGR